MFRVHHFLLYESDDDNLFITNVNLGTPSILGLVDNIRDNLIFEKPNQT